MRDPTRHDILKTLHSHHILSRINGWTAQQAEGGLNSRVYIVSNPKKQPTLTVRLAQPEKEWMLQREVDALRSLEHVCTCAQHVVGLLDTSDIIPQAMLVLTFANGATGDLGESSEAQINSLAACLASIHKHTRNHFTIWPGTEGVFGTRAQAFVARLQAVERYASFPDSGNSMLTEKVRLVYQQLGGKVLSGEGWDARSFSLLHGDLSRGNIIWDGSDVTLIDWEYTRAGDPAEELAYLLAEQQITAALHQLILTHYVEHGGDAAAVTRVPTYTALVALDSALWWADRYIDLGEDPGASPEVIYHLKRARQALD